MRRAFLAILLLVPTLASATTPLALFDAQAVDATGAQARGPLAALRIANPNDAAWMASGAERFTLTARELRVDTHRWTADYGTGVTTTPGRVDHATAAFTDATAASDVPRGMFELVLVPLPGLDAPRLSAQAPSLSLVAAPAQRITAIDWANAGTQVGTDAPASAMLTSLAPQRLVVEGSFQLSLWSWNVTVQPGTGFPSGSSSSTVARDPATGAVEVRERLEKDHVVLTIHNGRFAIDRLPPTPRLVAWSAVDLDATALDVRDARGTIETGTRAIPVDSALLHLEGALAAHIAPDRGLLSTSLGGHVTASTADGVALPLATAPAAGPGRWTLAWIGLALVAPATWGGRAWVRRRDRARMDDLEALVLMGDDRSVVAAARRLERHQDHGTDASALKVEALLRLGHAAEAEIFLQTLPAWTGPAAAMRDYLHALVAGARGDLQRARVCLARSLATAPELASDAAHQPSLAGVRGGPEPVEGYR